jgi:hypothetical protein
VTLSPYYVGQTYPAWAITWTDDTQPTPNPENLTGATITVAFRTQSGNAALAGYGAGTLTITNAAGGLLTYQPTATDVGTAGVFYVQFVATFADGRILVNDPIKFTVNALG